MRVCAVCGGDVDYEARSRWKKSLPHNEWRVGKHGPYQTGRLCDGSGRPTEEGGE